VYYQFQTPTNGKKAGVVISTKRDQIGYRGDYLEDEAGRIRERGEEEGGG
jgi:hypothetical protein